MPPRMTSVPFKVLCSFCDQSSFRQLAKKVDKVIIAGIPGEMFGLMTDSGSGIKFLENDRKVILYGGASSLIIPHTEIGGRHVLRIERKKCGTVSVYRHNSDHLLSSPDRQRQFGAFC